MRPNLTIGRWTNVCAALSLLGVIAPMLLAACNKAQSAGPLLNTSSCGPDFELHDPRYPPLVANKKQSLLSNGYPAEAINLLDKDGACVAAIERAPDIISIKLVFADGRRQTMEWTRDEENLARKDLLSGKLKAYYKFNADRRFACCNEARYDARPDWDPDDEVNAAVVIKCVSAGGQVSCQ